MGCRYDVCSWHGVTCDKDGVSALVIDDLWPQDYKPAKEDLACILEAVPWENLVFLQVLNFGGSNNRNSPTRLAGTGFHLPKRLMRLKSLRFLATHHSFDTEETDGMRRWLESLERREGGLAPYVYEVRTWDPNHGNLCRDLSTNQWVCPKGCTKGDKVCHDTDQALQGVSAPCRDHTGQCHKTLPRGQKTPCDDQCPARVAGAEKYAAGESLTDRCTAIYDAPGHQTFPLSENGSWVSHQPVFTPPTRRLTQLEIRARACSEYGLCNDLPGFREFRPDPSTALQAPADHSSTEARFIKVAHSVGGQSLCNTTAASSQAPAATSALASAPPTTAAASTTGQSTARATGQMCGNVCQMGGGVRGRRRVTSIHAT